MKNRKTLFHNGLTKKRMRYVKTGIRFIQQSAVVTPGAVINQMLKD